MNVNLHVEPNTPPMTREEFLQHAGRCSIALDGFVGEGPWYIERGDDAGPLRNFNHHEGVDRSSTRATCGQVLMAIRSGLFQAFRCDGQPHAEVYVNDCDEDVCLSWFLLHNAHISQSPTNPLLNRLVDTVDKMDTTAGAYPLPPDSPVLGEMAWVFNPYRRFRNSGGLAKRDAAEFRGVIEDVENRILRHVVGQGKSIPLDTRYMRLGGGRGWTMVSEIGAQARTGMFGDGITAFLAVRSQDNTRYDYVLGRQSEYVEFPVPKLLQALNEAEGLTGNDLWGGGTTIGGSPRISGSRLTPEDVAAVIDEVLQQE